MTITPTEHTSTTGGAVDFDLNAAQTTPRIPD